MKHSFRFAKSVEDLYDIRYDWSTLYQKSVRHSYLDWFLIPEERFMVAPADVKSTTIDIPASNGVLDLTETLTGAATFKSIEGTFSFYIDNDKILTLPDLYPDRNVEIFWVELYRDICAFLHGKVRYLMIEDDPQWIYKGRFSVGKYDASDGHWSQLKIDYILEPFKRLPWRDDNKWYFDSLNLNKNRLGQVLSEYHKIEDLINENVNIPINSDDYPSTGISFRCGEEPVVPTIHVVEDDEAGHLTLRIVNTEIGLDEEFVLTPKDGVSKEFDYYNRQIIFTNYNKNYYCGYDDKPNTLQVYIKGHGTVSFKYDIGVI